MTLFRELGKLASSVLEDLPEAVPVLDRAWRHQFVNARARDMLRLTRLVLGVATPAVGKVPRAESVAASLRVRAGGPSDTAESHDPPPAKSVRALSNGDLRSLLPEQGPAQMLSGPARAVVGRQAGQSLPGQSAAALRTDSTRQAVRDDPDDSEARRRGNGVDALRPAVADGVLGVVGSAHPVFGGLGEVFAAGTASSLRGLGGALGMSQRACDGLAPTGLGQLLITMSGSVVEVNGPLCTMLGYSREEVLVRRATDLVEVSDQQAAELRRRLTTIGVAGYSIADIFRRKDGTLLPALSTISLIEGSDGARLVSVIVHDHSSRREVERLRLDAERPEAVGSVAVGIAHDLNNVLAAVSGYAQALTWPAQRPSRTAQSAAGILQAVSQAEQMVARLLLLARGEVSVGPVTLVDLSVLLEDLEGMVRCLLPADVRLLRVSVSTVVQVDALQLRQLVLNLVANAGQALAGAGQVMLETDEVRLTGDLSLPDGVYAVLSVTDNAAGMTLSVMERCFERFFTTRNDRGGTGLGLATAREFARTANGDLRVHSEPGIGSAFVLLLPAATGGDVGPSGPSAAGASRSCEPSSG